MGNVVLTGGGSLFAGFADRLNSELARSFQHVRIFCYFVMHFIASFVTLQVKIHAPGNTVERRYGGWLGGSILASLGTFHQLWISKEEWQVGGFACYRRICSDAFSQEHGRPIVSQRCK